MNQVPVVITRPLRQAQMLASEVQRIGRHPVIFPLLEIKSAAHLPQVQACLQQLSTYALVVFVSPSAIDCIMPSMHHWPSAVNIGVVGEGSRLALSKYHDRVGSTTVFAPTDPLKSDSEGLLDVLPVSALWQKRVLIIRGQTGRDLLGKMLTNQGVEVEYLSAYERICPELTTARQMQLSAILKEKNDWIFTSSEALHFLMSWVKQRQGDELVALLQQQRIIVTHPHIQQTALTLGFSHVVLSGTGNKQLIAFLQS